MINIKKFILFTPTFVLALAMASGSLYAEDPVCDPEIEKKLTQNILGIEYQLQTTSLYKCKDIKDTNCYRADDPDSGSTMFEAKLAYNNALSKVVLLEGLIGLGHAIEGNHHAIKNLTPTKMIQAKKNIDDFFTNYQKANLLDISLNFIGDKKDKNIWQDYQGKETGDMISYLQGQCKDKDFAVFCLELNKLKINKNVDQEEIYKTLNGFVLSDRVARDDLGRKIEKYKEYQQYLTVKVDGEDVPLRTLTDNGEIKKIEELKTLIDKYSVGADNAKELLDKANKLQAVNINFNTGANANNRFKSFAEEQFGKTVNNIHVASSIINNSEGIEHNIKQASLSMENETKNSQRILDIKVNKFGKHIANKCTAYADTISCIRNLCKVNECGDHPKLKLLGLKGLYSDILLQDESDKISRATTSMKQCFHGAPDGTPDNKQQFNCLEDIKNSLGDLVVDDLAAAKKDLEAKKEIMAYIGNGEPIKQLEMEKVFGIKALHLAGCTEKEDYSKTKSMRSYCETPEIDGHISAAIKLKRAAEEVLISYDQQKLDKYLSQEYGPDKENNFKVYRDQLTKDCSENPEASDICKFYKKQISREVATAEEERLEIAARNTTVMTEDEQEEMDDYESTRSGFHYFGKGLLYSSVESLPWAMNMYTQNKKHEAQMSYYQGMHDNYNTMYQQNDGSYSYPIYQYNWGNTNPYDNNNFQANQSYLYYNQNDYFNNVSFAPVNVQSNPVFTP